MNPRVAKMSPEISSTPRSSAKATAQRIFVSSAVRNKLRRQSLYQRERQQRTRERKARREQRKREREQLGDKYIGPGRRLVLLKLGVSSEPLLSAPPKLVPKTLENTRILDETIVLPDDEEILQDEKTDEFAGYFDCKITPKVLIISVTKPSSKTHLLMRELKKCIPNSEIRQRWGIDLKKIVPQAVEREYTDILVLNEDKKIPNGLLIIHLPEGPTAHFKLTSFKRGYEIKGHGRATSHKPEVILNNFTTRLGHSVARMFASLFPNDPEFRGRRVITFHNQRDFIFIRHHRYIFRDAQKVGIQELGPRLTLKLRSLQKGTFDSKYGEYVWVHKRSTMDTNRRRFHL